MIRQRSLVLAEELHDPGRRVVLGEHTRQRCFDRIPQRREKGARTTFRALRRELVDRADTATVIEQKRLLGRQVLDPRQVIDEGTRPFVEAFDLALASTAPQWTRPDRTTREALSRSVIRPPPGNAYSTRS